MRGAAPLALLTVAIMLPGCATPHFLADRGRDALDTVTLTTGKGYGAMVRVGPLHCGLLCAKDYAGVKQGDMSFGARPAVKHPLDGFGKTLDPLIVLPNLGGGSWCFWYEDFRGWTPMTSLRGKEYYVSAQLPFVAVPVLADLDKRIGLSYPTFFLTQLEVVVGAWRTVRVGFNLGESMDFLLGWTTVDVLHDDLRHVAPKQGSDEVDAGDVRTSRHCSNRWAAR
jgi:hypothetical protein